MTTRLFVYRKIISNLLYKRIFFNLNFWLQKKGEKKQNPNQKSIIFGSQIDLNQRPRLVELNCCVFRGTEIIFFLFWIFQPLTHPSRKSPQYHTAKFGCTPQSYTQLRCWSSHCTMETESVGVAGTFRRRALLLTCDYIIWMRRLVNCFTVSTHSNKCLRVCVWVRMWLCCVYTYDRW